MRWWQALRQAYPNRSAITLAIAVLVVCTLVGGGVLATTAVTFHATSTEKFCSDACHDQRHAAAEFKGTVHDKNRIGVRAECADCHIPKELVPMMIRKVEAAREIWGHFTGKIDTDEKYEKHRHAMATREWTRMKKNDSQECRNCHRASAADFEAQSENAQKRHKMAREQKLTCIDCHFGIAHTEPDGPGPREIKIQ